MYIRTFLLLLLIFNSFHVYADHDGNSFLDQLQKTYESIQNIKADFEHVYRSLRFEEKKSKGTVAISKPGKMRWDYKIPKGRILVSDGAFITLYDPEDQQALVSPQPKDGSFPLALSFLMGEGKLKEKFRAEVAPQSKNSKLNPLILRCKPKDFDPNLSEIYLTLDTEDPIKVVGTRIIDGLGGESEISFSNIDLKAKIVKNFFEFKLPKGAVKVSMPTGNIKMQ